MREKGRRSRRRYERASSSERGEGQDRAKSRSGMFSHKLMSVFVGAQVLMLSAKSTELLALVLEEELAT